MGTSLTITVPDGPNRKYRISSRVTAYTTSAGNYIWTTVSTSQNSVANMPTGMADIYEYMLDTGWHTTDLAPGTYTYYTLVYGGASYTAIYDFVRTKMIAWPM